MSAANDRYGVPRAHQCPQELSRTDADIAEGAGARRSENPSFHWFGTVILEHPPVGSARCDLPSRLAPAAPRRQLDPNRSPRPWMLARNIPESNPGVGAARGRAREVAIIPELFLESQNYFFDSLQRIFDMEHQFQDPGHV